MEPCNFCDHRPRTKIAAGADIACSRTKLIPAGTELKYTDVFYNKPTKLENGDFYEKIFLAKQQKYAINLCQPDDAFGNNLIFKCTYKDSGTISVCYLNGVGVRDYLYLRYEGNDVPDHDTLNQYANLLGASQAKISAKIPSLLGGFYRHVHRIFIKFYFSNRVPTESFVSETIADNGLPLDLKFCGTGTKPWQRFLISRSARTVGVVKLAEDVRVTAIHRGGVTYWEGSAFYDNLVPITDRVEKLPTADLNKKYAKIFSKYAGKISNIWDLPEFVENPKKPIDRHGSRYNPGETKPYTWKRFKREYYNSTVGQKLYGWRNFQTAVLQKSFNSDAAQPAADDVREWYRNSLFFANELLAAAKSVWREAVDLISPNDQDRIREINDKFVYVGFDLETNFSPNKTAASEIISIATVAHSSDMTFMESRVFYWHPWGSLPDGGMSEDVKAACETHFEANPHVPRETRNLLDRATGVLTVKRLRDENELIETFLRYVTDLNAKGVYGYNSDRFDMAVLEQRMIYWNQNKKGEQFSAPATFRKLWNVPMAPKYSTFTYSMKKNFTSFEKRKTVPVNKTTSGKYDLSSAIDKDPDVVCFAASKSAMTESHRRFEALADPDECSDYLEYVEQEKITDMVKLTNRLNGEEVGAIDVMQVMHGENFEKLDVTAQTEMNMGKTGIEYSEIYGIWTNYERISFARFLAYNAIDAFLCLALLARHAKDYIRSAESMTRLIPVKLCGMFTGGMTMIVCSVKSQEGWEKNEVLTAPKEFSRNNKFMYKPGYVYTDSDFGKLKPPGGTTADNPIQTKTPIAVIDYSSQYGRIMINRNPDESTVITDEAIFLQLPEDVQNRCTKLVLQNVYPEVKDHNCAAIMKGRPCDKERCVSYITNRACEKKVWVIAVSDFPSLNHIVCDKFTKRRKRVKKMMKLVPEDSMEYDILNNLQLNLKLICNSCYGVSFKTEPLVGGVITLYGRMDIRMTTLIMALKGMMAIYGDTDSSFNKMAPDAKASSLESLCLYYDLPPELHTQHSLLQKIFHRVQQAVDSINETASGVAVLEVEKVFPSGVTISGMKNYLGVKVMEAGANKFTSKFHAAGMIAYKAYATRLQRLVHPILQNLFMMEKLGSFLRLLRDCYFMAENELRAIQILEELDNAVVSRGITVDTSKYSAAKERIRKQCGAGLIEESFLLSYQKVNLSKPHTKPSKRVQVIRAIDKAHEPPIRVPIATPISTQLGSFASKLVDLIIPGAKRKTGRQSDLVNRSDITQMPDYKVDPKTGKNVQILDRSGTVASARFSGAAKNLLASMSSNAKDIAKEIAAIKFQLQHPVRGISCAEDAYNFTARPWDKRQTTQESAQRLMSYIERYRIHLDRYEAGYYPDKPILGKNDSFTVITSANLTNSAQEYLRKRRIVMTETGHSIRLTITPNAESVTSAMTKVKQATPVNCCWSMGFESPTCPVISLESAAKVLPELKIGESVAVEFTLAEIRDDRIYYVLHQNLHQRWVISQSTHYSSEKPALVHFEFADLEEFYRLLKSLSDSNPKPTTTFSSVPNTDKVKVVNGKSEHDIRTVRPFKDEEDDGCCSSPNLGLHSWFYRWSVPVPTAHLLNVRKYQNTALTGNWSFSYDGSILTIKHSVKNLKVVCQSEFAKKQKRTLENFFAATQAKIPKFNSFGDHLESELLPTKSLIEVDSVKLEKRGRTKKKLPPAPVLFAPDKSTRKRPLIPVDSVPYKPKPKKRRLSYYTRLPAAVPNSLTRKRPLIPVDSVPYKPKPKKRRLSDYMSLPTGIPAGLQVPPSETKKKNTKKK